MRRGEPGTAHRRFIAGEHDCPPEDRGGIAGFYEMLKATADPSYPDYAEITGWLDEIRPERTGNLPIEVALGKIAACRNTARDASFATI